MHKKIIVTSSLALTALIFASPVLAASADVAKIETFIKSVIQVASLSGAVWDISLAPATPRHLIAPKKQSSTQRLA